jgi:hypothetical protein
MPPCPFVRRTGKPLDTDTDCFTPLQKSLAAASLNDADAGLIAALCRSEGPDAGMPDICNHTAIQAKPCISRVRAVSNPTGRVLVSINGALSND